MPTSAGQYHAHLNVQVIESHVGKPRQFWNDVVLFDIHLLSIPRTYQVAHSKSAWRAQTCSTRT